MSKCKHLQGDYQAWARTIALVVPHFRHAAVVLAQRRRSFDRSGISPADRVLPYRLSGSTSATQIVPVGEFCEFAIEIEAFGAYLA